VGKLNQTYSMDQITLKKLAELKQYTGSTKSALINRAVQELHKKEVKK
jgi:hypothetical protein